MKPNKKQFIANKITFEKGQLVKTPNGATLRISHFLEVTNELNEKGKRIKFKRDSYKPGYKIVIGSIGTFKAEELEIVDARYFEKISSKNLNKIIENQKQFKEFNPELFKYCIDKFSDEDKLQALNVLVCSISTTDIKFNSLLNQISDYR